MTTHTDLAAGRWTALSLAEQLANVGSEVDRAIAAWAARRVDRFDRALARVLELFDLTVRDERWRGHRRREILRAREEFCRLFFDNAAPSDAARSLKNYFLHFAVLARQPARPSARPREAHPVAQTDLPIEQILEAMQRWMAFGLDAYLRWTCPKCHERVMADQPNVYHASGYRHAERADGTPCGGVYRDALFGLAVTVPDMSAEEFNARLSRLPPEVYNQLKGIWKPGEYRPE